MKEEGKRKKEESKDQRSKIKDQKRVKGLIFDFRFSYATYDLLFTDCKASS